MSDDDDTLAMLRKLKEKGKALAADAKAKPKSVDEAAERERELLKKEEEQKKYLKMLADTDVPAHLKGEYDDVVDSFADAHKQVKAGIERSRVITSMSRALPSARKKRIDVVFCFDATGSMAMGDIIDVVKLTIAALVAHLASVSSLDVRVGFIAYRDYDDTPRFERCELMGPATDALNVFARRLGEVRATGGGDAAEDVLGGLQEAARLFDASNPEDNKLIIWAGDAPGHGLHDGTVGDNHKGGDKFGLTVENVMSQLLMRRITMACLCVNSTTDIMLRQFNAELARGGVGCIQERASDPKSCTNQLQRLLVTASSVSRSHRTGTDMVAAKKRDVPQKANFNDPAPTESLTGTVLYREGFSVSPSTATEVVKALIKAKTLAECHLVESKAAVTMNVEVPYFACGGVRFAHKATIGRDNVCAKSFQSGPDNVERHIDEYRCTLIADALTVLFVDKLGIRPDQFCYVRTQIFKRTSAGGHPSCARFYSLEQMVTKDVPFKKFNSNGGYVDPSFELAQAFSHFTWHVCDGSCMILDLQGWASKDGYLLTDPAVQTTNRSMLPTDTNIGLEAMQDFFKAHKCGPSCKKLGLPEFKG